MLWVQILLVARCTGYNITWSSLSDLLQVSGFHVSPTTKTDCHNKTEILWKVALNTITLIIFDNLCICLDFYSQLIMETLKTTFRHLFENDKSTPSPKRDHKELCVWIVNFILLPYEFRKNSKNFTGFKFKIWYL